MTAPLAQVERSVKFQSAGQPAFALEGTLHAPMQPGKAPAAILCSPQPVSSDMNDPLTVTLATRLAQAGIYALRFNFRGVGNSQGQQTDGRLEPLDLAGGVNFVMALPIVNRAKICVVGHAFGANVAMMYAPYDQRVRTVVAVSLLIYRLPQGGFPKSFEGPKLFITAEDDQLCPLFKLEPFVEQQKGPKGIKVIRGARHLMHGYEDAAAETIVNFVRKWAALPGV